MSPGGWNSFRCEHEEGAVGRQLYPFSYQPHELTDRHFAWNKELVLVDGGHIGSSQPFNDNL